MHLSTIPMNTPSSEQDLSAVPSQPRRVEETSTWKKPTTWEELEFFVYTILPSLVRQRPKGHSAEERDRFETLKNQLANALFHRPAGAKQGELLPPDLQTIAEKLLIMEGGLEEEPSGDQWGTARVTIGNWTRKSLQVLTGKAD